jgi:uncharacterized protein YkwD
MRMPTAKAPVGLQEQIIPELLDLHNEIRQRLSLKPLSKDRALVRAAFKHCQWMAEQAKMQHAGDGGSSPGQRATAQGFTWGKVAENIAAKQITPVEVMSHWKASKGDHYTHIILPDVTHWGGCCLLSVDEETQAETPYWCCLFAREMGQ